ncbi:MAG TPA: methyl-accepting chemotaxis protein, partial [Thiobacillaceae bacterium]|nr:methyl-accepting chemotaxis protein [Thiobacillaceae bacterium]
MIKAPLSVQSKIVITITLIFIAALATSTLLTARNERDLAVSVGIEKARDLAQSYFDGVNTMMLTGTMDQRDNLRKKFLSVRGVREMRIAHAPGRLAGLSNRESKPQDALEERGTNGETVAYVGEDASGRFVTVVKPLTASANYLGTNCLGCHQVPEGTVLGAVRATYSLAELDGEFRSNLMVVAGLNLLLSMVGISLVVFLLRRIVVAPLLAMRGTMGEIERHSDLGRRLAADRMDEVGALAQAVNSMLDKFATSLGRVAENASRLASAANRVARVSEITVEATQT